MPIVFRTSLDLDLVYAHWSGAVTMEEWRRIFLGYLSDANYRPGRTELTDFSDVQSTDAGFKSIWSALNTVNGQVPGLKVHTRTVMIAPDEVMFGLARIYQSLAANSDGISVEVFRTPAEALAALGLPFATTDELVARGNFLPFTPMRAAGDGT
jgi:hypothetical protein